MCKNASNHTLISMVESSLGTRLHILIYDLVPRPSLYFQLICLQCILIEIELTMSMATGSDDICGIDQLASGLKAGIEGVIHAMSDLYEENAGSGWSLLLVDAKNAFNVVKQSHSLMECTDTLARVQPFSI